MQKRLCGGKIREWWVSAQEGCSNAVQGEKVALGHFVRAVRACAKACISFFQRVCAVVKGDEAK